MLGGLLLRTRRFLNRHWLPLFAFTLLAYFSYHAIDGSRGLLAWRDVGRELEAAGRELAEIRAERRKLERKVRHLRQSSLDPDLLDEAARRTLSLVHPQDVIVLIEPPSEAAR